MTEDIVIQRTLHWSRFLAKRLKIEAVPVAVEFSTRMTRSAGKASVNCHTREGTVRYSRRFMNEASFDEVIAHEVAHIYANLIHEQNVGHSSQWKAIMQLTGYSTARCHRYTAMPRTRASTKTVICRDCNTTLRVGKTVQRRIRRGTEYCCSRCRATIRPEDLAA